MHASRGVAWQMSGQHTAESMHLLFALLDLGMKSLHLLLLVSNLLRQQMSAQ